VSGSIDALSQPVRGVIRTRAAPPQLPSVVDGEALVVDALVIDAMLASGRPLDALVALIDTAGLRPACLFLAAAVGRSRPEAASDRMPILASGRTAAQLAGLLDAHLREEASELARLAAELRLVAAEAALADPQPAAAGGAVAARILRGVAVAADGELRSVHPRPAGRALAARFVATYGRLLSGTSSRGDSTRRTRDGLWLLERRIRPGATLWLFDDIPFARIDEVAADALTMTLRALLRRPARPGTTVRPAVARSAATPDSPADRIQQTLVAVARANGRVTPAARALGVHRNTVLYRLRQAAVQGALDPRRAEDALRILAAEARRQR
jgi:PucR C-terminal helix-turn-helix domain